MMVIVFRSRGSAATDPEISEMRARMYALASVMPGFVSHKDFRADDGEDVSIIEFDTAEHLEAWSNHPEHRAVQARARRRLFSEYRIQVCSLVQQTSFPERTPF